MRLPVLLVAAALPLSACMTANETQIVETGYERGSLGVAAIGRGDWASAELRLKEDHGVSVDDPARLINLGRVYLETGRRDEALAMWRRAIASDSHFMAETASGRVVSTDVLAREAIARYAPAEQIASR